MKLVKISQELLDSNKNFDCEDEDSNEFLFDDAIKKYEDLRLAKTYLLIDDDNIVGYFSLTNDKLVKDDYKSRRAFQREKGKLRSVPAVKIGRLAIDKKYKKRGLAKTMIFIIKDCFYNNNNKTGCSLLTLDAYKDKQEMYNNWGFELVPLKDELLSENTVLMYYALDSFAADTICSTIEKNTENIIIECPL